MLKILTGSLKALTNTTGICIRALCHYPLYQHRVPLSGLRKNHYPPTVSEEKDFGQPSAAITLGCKLQAETDFLRRAIDAMPQSIIDLISNTQCLAAHTKTYSAFVLLATDLLNHKYVMAKGSSGRIYLISMPVDFVRIHDHLEIFLCLRDALRDRDELTPIGGGKTILHAGHICVAPYAISPQFLLGESEQERMQYTALAERILDMTVNQINTSK